MKIHLVDGTYEIFRCYFGAPSSKTKAGREVGATRGLLRSFAAWLRTGEVTHAACAFDSVIESFRNLMFAGYKTSEGIDPELYAQFELVERAVAAMGIVVWPMIEFEADDALASGAQKYGDDKRVEQVRICSPDKDLAQCVDGNRIVGWDRWKQQALNEAGVIAKFGVPPNAIPDLLALVGDTADGIPGIDRWGMKSASVVLAEYGSLENIPMKSKEWKPKVRGADALAETLAAGRTDALLYRELATLRRDVALEENLDDLQWHGADREALGKICDEIEEGRLMDRIERWR